MPDETPQSSAALSKAETLAQIKAVIQDLEVLVSRLDEETIEPVAATPVLTTLTQTVADLADVLEPAATEETIAAALDDVDVTASEPEESKDADSDSSEAIAALETESDATEPETTETESEPDDWLGDVQPETPPTPEGSDRLGQLQTLWALVLQKIRALLPTELSEKLSDQVLTAVISGVVVFALAIPILSGSGSPSEPEAIAPSPQPAPIFPSEQPTEVLPTPVEPVPVKPAPPKRPQRLTPEQKLIASIQDQVAQITDQYAEGLIQSLQVDFMAGRLRVLMGSGWYDLERDRQDQVAAEVLARAQRLDFTKVEMIDEAETLLARNAVVGNKMLIFQREPLVVEGEFQEDEMPIK
ncbi:MAG: hypothetical protein F6J87_08915 [Spirulina sp. SIO3F2]|nr:hypothetical protein [Spirulina sp. SIO3F2]